MILRSMLHSSANEALCCTLAGANKVMFDLTMYLYKLLDDRRQDLLGIVFNLIHFTETLVPLILLIFASSFQMAIISRKKSGIFFAFSFGCFVPLDRRCQVTQVKISNSLYL